MLSKKLARAKGFIAALENENRPAFERLRLANRAKQEMDAYIAATVEIDQLQPRGKRLTWEKIGQALDLSKSAVFVRYGKKREANAEHSRANDNPTNGSRDISHGSGRITQKG